MPIGIGTWGRNAQTDYPRLPSRPQLANTAVWSFLSLVFFFATSDQQLRFTYNGTLPFAIGADFLLFHEEHIKLYTLYNQRY